MRARQMLRQRKRMPPMATQAETDTETARSERRVRAALERNHELGKGLTVGKTFKIHGADGAAWYEVTRVGSTSVDVEWRDYGLDRSMDEMLAGGGTFPVPVIERLVHHHETLDELFGALA
jgi:hypothetical protein